MRFGEFYTLWLGTKTKVSTVSSTVLTIFSGQISVVSTEGNLANSYFRVRSFWVWFYIRNLNWNWLNLI